MSRSTYSNGGAERFQHRATDRACLVAPPSESQLESMYPGADLADAYAVDLPSNAAADAGELARFVMAHPPPWVFPLIAVRDAVMGTLGSKTAGAMKREGFSGKSGAVGSFPVLGRSVGEIVMGADDSHLDFRTAMLVRHLPTGERDLCWITVVRCHNLFGRLYIRVIAPFHRAIIVGYLNRAAKVGWPATSIADNPPEDNDAGKT